jgi:O-antigen chain-terminating methyltransferase
MPEELTEVIREIRERVRARHPGTSADGMALPDLTPIVHARDAAEAKVASIGTVNPRRPGLINGVLQKLKRLAARMLDWHVREQVEFNRALISSVGSILEALNENNRALARLAQMDADLRARLSDAVGSVGENVTGLEERIGSLGQQVRDFQEEMKSLSEEARSLGEEARELKDVRTHWAEWRQEWERKLSINEMQFLRSVADLQGAFQHRVTLMESNFRGMVKSQHSDFTGALDRSGLEIQKRLWADLEKVRAQFERLIHTELRLIRQRAALAPPGLTPPPTTPAEGQTFHLDYARFAERFRGSEQFVRRAQEFYLPFFAGRQAVLDLGCGRGEFLQLMKEAGVEARGVDASAESVALCRSKGLAADCADLFVYLQDLPDSALDGIFCAQVVEHLPAGRLPDLIRLAASKLSKGGLVTIETPNPECLAIFSTHFYLDPTHTRPIPPALLRFYMEEAGLGQIEVHPLSPAMESMSSLAGLPDEFRNAFFGGLDYAIIGRKL